MAILLILTLTTSLLIPASVTLPTQTSLGDVGPERKEHMEEFLKHMKESETDSELRGRWFCDTALFYWICGSDETVPDEPVTEEPVPEEPVTEEHHDDHDHDDHDHDQ